ncbi:RHS repeat-associated core domain-containing protein, partial [Verrucomicrobium sp. BvORR106]|uniref:RHS repeat-associated core domain-containing protein n=1 Tax=Verrucomicrobium sp. BvORR106 TaxID=1403819 RepID=UPI00056FCE9C
RAYTVPSSGGRDNRGRLLAAQTRLTGRSVDVVAEAITWTSDSRQASYAATRLTANDGTGTATWQDARNYQYSTQRRQLVSESWVPGDGQAGKSQGHEHDFGLAGGLGIYTGRETPAPTGSTGSQLFVVNDAGMAGGTGIDAFGRVTREVSGFENLGLTAQGTAKGAKSVELTVNTNSQLSEVQFPAATRFLSGAWSRQLWLPAGGYNLLAKGNHPSGQFSAQASASFDIGVRHFGVESVHDDNGNVTYRHVAGGIAQNGRSQSLTWDGLGRLVKVVQEEFGGFGFEWTATYDGLSRRLQTTYVAKRENLYRTAEQVIERSWYDPLVEFLEVGIEVTRGGGGTAQSERWWKVHGPDLNGGYGGLGGIGGLEALVNEATGQATGTTDDFNGHIVGFAKAASLSAAGAGSVVYEWNDARFGGYGPLSGGWSASVSEGAAVWRTFGWRGRRLDATGYVHLGARYYEPNSGRFLSPDPLGHGASMSLYDYANGDPVGFVDPSGRSALDIWSSSITANSSILGFEQPTGSIAGKRPLDLDPAYWGNQAAPTTAAQSTFSNIYQYSPTARNVYDYAKENGYQNLSFDYSKAGGAQPGMAFDGSNKNTSNRYLIFPNDVTDPAFNYTPYHEAGHVVQRGYRNAELNAGMNYTKPNPYLMGVINDIRYASDGNEMASELEMRRLTNRIAVEVYVNSGGRVMLPLLTHYGSTKLAPGTEFGRGTSPGTFLKGYPALPSAVQQDAARYNAQSGKQWYYGQDLGGWASKTFPPSTGSSGHPASPPPSPPSTPPAAPKPLTLTPLL